MEPLEKAYYETRFENRFLKAKGNAFQTFFNDLMGRVYKSDYMPCRPWGNRGDRKNDGFLKSERRLFQVYAPNEMTEKEAIDKIREDFEGAKSFWFVHFDKWSFVHNAYDGIPPHVQKEMLDLEQANLGIKLDPWGLEELRIVFRLIQREDLESWFGYAPNLQAKVRLGFEDIRVVLETIASRKPDSGMPVKQVPPKKIEANQLSERYDSLRGSMTPNEIFYEIQAWVGGSERGTAEHEMAVLSVISYYFESCDIFEEPRRVD